uniref:EGF-like domain-containing protein n=1 Tax=Globodera pallida TaxID=36090 RepID=A0A183CAQ0_GLOPA
MIGHKVGISISALILLLSCTLFDANKTQQQQPKRIHRRSGGAELFEVRIFEGAPPGTKGTPNEAFDRALRQQSSCFAQLESDLDWLDFDPVRLVFETVAELPANNSRPAQFAVLHLLCPQHKQHSLHFSVHISRRNRHPPRFSSSDYRFFAPTNLAIGAEIGRVPIQDQDPIIYNSQVQLSVVRASGPSGKMPTEQKAGGLSDEWHWEVLRNGSIRVRKPLSDLRLFRPHQIRLLAVDFGSPQLFSLANVTIVPVSVSQPRNLRVNVANWRYQIFEWELPSTGVPERFRLTLRRKGELVPLHEQEMEPTEAITMSRVRLPLSTELAATISAVDVHGETPSEEIAFQAVESDFHCPGQCASGSGQPMCHYSRTHQMEQYRDSLGSRHCLCYAGFSGSECEHIEHCAAQRAFESYGGVDWPETAVNQTVSVPCPYNEDGKRVERRCGWAEKRGEPRWEDDDAGGEGARGAEDAKEGTEGHCKSQSSVLVHLGVLANYAQRAEQTLSGLQSVLRFLDSLLLFPAFDPAVPSAHFDAKIAEHVAQVLDSLVARNLSAFSGGGNATQLGTHLLDYSREFARRLPVPFSLQSAAGGFHMRSWHILPSSNRPNADVPIDQHHQQNDGLQLGHCLVRPPSFGRPKSEGHAVAKAICMRNSTLLPLLNGRSPLLLMELKWQRKDEGIGGKGKNGSAIGGREMPGEWDGGTAADHFPLLVIGLQTDKRGTKQPNWQITRNNGEQQQSGAIKGEDDGNLTCAFFDQQTHVWSVAGVRVMSREHRINGQQALLCEFRFVAVRVPSMFALLPESLFLPHSPLEFWLGIVAPLIGALLTLGTLLGLLLISAFYHRGTDPALLVLLLAQLLLHAFHVPLLLRPLLPPAAVPVLWPSSPVLFFCLQLALLSASASLALLNAHIHSRIVSLELAQCQNEQQPKAPSRSARFLSTLAIATVIPCALCVLSSILDGQIVVGLDLAEPRLLPFNWTFGLTFLLPLVLFLATATGYGAYSLWYGNSLAAGHASGDVSIALRRLLHQLSSAAGTTLLVLLFSFGNVLVLLQPPEMTRSVFLASLYLCSSVSLCSFLRLLSRVRRRLPYIRQNAVANSLRQNSLVAGVDGCPPALGNSQHGAKRYQHPPVILFQSGECQAIAPNGICGNGGGTHLVGSNGTIGHPGGPNGLDRQSLLRRSGGSQTHRPQFRHPSGLFLPPINVCPVPYRPRPSSLPEADDDEAEDEDLEAFLESGTDTLRALGRQRPQQQPSEKRDTSPQHNHPLLRAEFFNNSPSKLSSYQQQKFETVPPEDGRLEEEKMKPLLSNQKPLPEPYDRRRRDGWSNLRKRKPANWKFWLPLGRWRKRIWTSPETPPPPQNRRKAAQFVYTSSRKANKEARMEQGPREYESCKEIGIDFCARTTSHGIPFVGAHSFFGRFFWTCVTAIAFCSFIIQTYFTLSDYLDYRTIIEMQLKFEPAPFPAATICNLNAFKLSEVRKFQEIEQGIQLWEKAISTLDRLKETPLRRRRQAVYRPVYVRCVCTVLDDQCVPQRNELDRNASPGQEIHWWNPHNYTVYPSTAKPPVSGVEQAFGLEDLKDRGAITTKTKENLIFLVAGMSTEVRKSLSYRLEEFVLRCSFNSRDCDLKRDFQIQIDPVFGNCWTFNFNDSVELKNSRAGPMYGLRLLLNVNQSDYMPTTEAAGVRIVVHEQDQEPFPDTFGYSAPTGFVSSFGLKTKIVNRLDAPYGKCSDTFRPYGYIYAEHYSPEGCYRNCFQHIILERCGCGDPRFPLPNESEDRPCDARSPKERLCLANQTAVLGGFHHLTHDCHCVQPCTEHVFETAYSAAAWPALNFNIGGDDCALVLGTNFSKAKCTEYFTKNTALIEIYYEQLNYEKLKETPGYTLVNLFSDLGGNIGLWIGFSLITVMEVVELIFECLTFGLVEEANELSDPYAYTYTFGTPYGVDIKDGGGTSGGASAGVHYAPSSKK